MQSNFIRIQFTSCKSAKHLANLSFAKYNISSAAVYLQKRLAHKPGGNNEPPNPCDSSNTPLIKRLPSSRSYRRSWQIMKMHTCFSPFLTFFPISARTYFCDVALACCLFSTQLYFFHSWKCLGLIEEYGVLIYLCRSVGAAHNYSDTCGMALMMFDRLSKVREPVACLDHFRVLANGSAGWKGRTRRAFCLLNNKLICSLPCRKLIGFLESLQLISIF